MSRFVSFFLLSIFISVSSNFVLNFNTYQIWFFFLIFFCVILFLCMTAINLLIFVSMRKYSCEFLLTGVLVFKFRGRLGLFHTSNFPSLLVTYTLMTMCNSSLEVWKTLCLSVCLFLVVFLFSKIFQKIKLCYVVDWAWLHCNCGLHIINWFV
jgi:hypothetical protein